MILMDYEKVFDSVNTGAVSGALKHQAIKQTYLRLPDGINDERTGRIILHKQSYEFTIQNRALQGDTISSNFFTACLESVLRKLDWENVG